MGYRYITFDGVERATFRAAAGQNISLDYDFTVEKGALTLEIVAPDGESMWEETYRADADESVTLTAPQKGRYQVRLKGAATGGSFDLSWSVGE
jgi:methionine-rich copper-binding protein CopC